MSAKFRLSGRIGDVAFSHAVRTFLQTNSGRIATWWYSVSDPPPVPMLRLLPWKFLVKHAARRYGVLEPAMVLARMRSFAQPSEVAEPLELLRAGILFHARGLVNAKAIQHNLDWVWPFWVERQFNPDCQSFVPRAFSFSHINLTHRNWTAVGLPESPLYPIVDPRGLVTPLYDGWSLDFWIVTEAGQRLLPSKLEDHQVEQRLLFDPTLTVTTVCRQPGLELELATHQHQDSGGPPELRTEVHAKSDHDGWLVVAVRPYNPEGVQFIDRIAIDDSGTAFHVNNEATVFLGGQPDALRMAHYAEGDVYLDLPGDNGRGKVTCDVGMATGAALFRLGAGTPRKLTTTVTLERDIGDLPHRSNSSRSWQEALEGTSKLQIPDSRMQFLYDAAVRTLLLLSADDLVPGPYTYRRFWFRDACLMLHPLLAIGQVDRAARIVASFPDRQRASGYFPSQEGEWDSNGQVLWIVARMAGMIGKPLASQLDLALVKGMQWLASKRLKSGGALGTNGLLPAGFSAEHLGPNDYYYWDDFWAWGGLKAVAQYWKQNGNGEAATEAQALADDYARAIEASYATIPQNRARGAIPAAPGRRLDAGAIGSMVADYPLQLYPPGETRIMLTTEFLIDRCFHHGGFFQEMIHSGINAYLTLDLAQTLLRAGDPRFANLMRRVAELASPTGQWPEAIHPLTLGGCMGDGQHGWAAGEWIMMVRNCFVREEADHVVIGSGILPEWLTGGEIAFGPTLTAWGPVSVRLADSQLTLDADWRNAPPRVKVVVPGYAPIEDAPANGSIKLQRL